MVYLHDQFRNGMSDTEVVDEEKRRLSSLL